MRDPGATATASAFAPRRLTSQGEELDLLVSSAGPDRPPVVLPAAPALARDAAGQPQLSLSLLLSRRPRAGDALVDLVQGGLLGFTAAVEVPPWALQALAAEGPLPRPLFARAARFALGLPGGGPALARAEAAGPAPRAALSALLSAEDACRVLAALRGAASGLELRVELDWHPPGRGLETVALAMPLEAGLARPPAGPLDLDRLVRLTAPPAPGLPPEEVPPRVAAAVPRAGPGGPALAVSAGRITTLTAALHPAPAPAAAAAQAAALSPAITAPGRLGSIGVVFDGGGVLAGAGPLPVVQDPAAALWPDRADPTRRWWAPALELVRPGPNDDPSASPFRFGWRQTGVTGGPDPTPGLEGSVLFTLRVVQSGEVTAALHAAGDPPATRVPLDGLAVALEVPFREEGTGQTRAQLFPATVEVQGDLVKARVSLLDGWVRLCYGALAYEGFQAQPARLRISWSFPALVPVPPLAQLAFGGKIASIPLLQAGALAARTAFDPAAGTLHLGGVQVRFAPEGGAARRDGPPPPVARLVEVERERAMPLLAANVALHPQPAAVATLHGTAPVAVPAVVARPELEVSPAWLHPLHQARYLNRTIARAQALDALLPCKDAPTSYRRVEADGTDAAAGCQDALRLGEIQYRQYEELPELRRDDAGGRLCSVYRSLQQPGRYLVAPARWRISRYASGAGEGRAYRPTAMVYALRDADAPETRYFLSAQLEPDLPLHVRRDLARRLAALAPTGPAPVIDFPTEPSLQAKIDVQWAVPDRIAAPQTAATWDGFQVTVSAGLADALLLTTAIEKGGITGQAAFTLPDGQALTGELRLDTAFTGPWSGPLEVQALGPRATLRNRLDVPVDVAALLPDAGRSDAAVPVEAALAPGTSLDVALSGPAPDPCPVATPRPGSPRLAETDVFVEDITLGVIFVNLVAYANHGIAGLALDARLQGTDHVYGVDLQEGQHATLELQLPLDRYVQSQVLELRLRATPAVGAAVASGWWTWDLEAKGSVVSVTPDLLPAASRAIAPPPRQGSGPTAGPGSGGARRKDGAMKRSVKRGGPLGISIHIGLNHVDPGAYDGWDGELSGCINDANAMKGIAQAMGYDPIHTLIDEQATAEGVLSAICDAANQLQSGDHLLLTYSGHGGQIPDETGDEDDRLDETWVLHDRQLLDDELYCEWAKFAGGVRIFMLSDSCHSGTVLKYMKKSRDAHAAQLDAATARMQDYQRLQQAAAAARGLRAAPPKLRAIPPAKAFANYQANQGQYRTLQLLLKGGAQNSRSSVGATVLLISGCQDNQFSQDGSTNGLFTEKLLDVWDSGSFQGNHHDFYSAILDKMPSEQTPAYRTAGTTIDLAFLDMRPFLIGEAQAGQGTSTGDTSTAARPTIRGPASVSADDEAPTLQVDPSPYGFYAVEVATDPKFFYGGTGQRTAANSYCSWNDVHRTARGSDPEFTVPATAWKSLQGAGRLYLRVWATKNAAAADWQPYQVADGDAPIEVSGERGAVVPPPAPASRVMPPANGDTTQAAMH